MKAVFFALIGRFGPSVPFAVQQFEAKICILGIKHLLIIFDHPFITVSLTFRVEAPANRICIAVYLIDAIIGLVIIPSTLAVKALICKINACIKAGGAYQT